MVSKDNMERIARSEKFSGGAAKNMLNQLFLARLMGGNDGGGSRGKSAADYYNEERLHKKKVKASAKASTKSRKDIITHQTNERIRLAREIAADKEARAEAKEYRNGTRRNVSNKKPASTKTTTTKPKATTSKPKAAPKSTSKPVAKTAVGKGTASKTAASKTSAPAVKGIVKTAAKGTAKKASDVAINTAAKNTKTSK